MECRPLPSVVEGQDQPRTMLRGSLWHPTPHPLGAFAARLSAILRRHPRPRSLCAQRTCHSAWISAACVAACGPRRMLPAHIRMRMQTQYSMRSAAYCAREYAVCRGGHRADTLSSGICDVAAANADDVHVRCSCVSAGGSIVGARRRRAAIGAGASLRLCAGRGRLSAGMGLGRVVRMCAGMSPACMGLMYTMGFPARSVLMRSMFFSSRGALGSPLGAGRRDMRAVGTRKSAHRPCPGRTTSTACGGGTRRSARAHTASAQHVTIALDSYYAHSRRG